MSVAALIDEGVSHKVKVNFGKLKPVFTLEIDGRLNKRLELRFWWS